ncbi:beta4GalNAcTB pilot [Carabus blaptoides fortunei]
MNCNLNKLTPKNRTHKHTSLLIGQPISTNQRTSLMATLQDRIRIPWRGGAKQVSADTIIPVVLVPVGIFLAAFDLILTVLVFTFFPLFLNHTFVWFRANHPKTKFFVIWTLISCIAIALIFEVKVIALLEILPEENIALFVLTMLFLLCVYRLKVSANRWHYTSVTNEVEALPDTEGFCTTCKRMKEERMYHCTICQVCVPERDCHFIWYDCCIGQGNNGMFLLSLVLAIASLLYSSNLTLTTVCHPFTVFETVLLPDDCSEVYEQYDMALCFVSAIYSILIAAYLLWILLRQCLVVSLGYTGQEWRQMSLATKLCCGFNSPRPYSLGFCRNWLKLMCNKENTRSNTYIDT